MAIDADFLAGLALVADVDLAGRVFAHKHGGEAGDGAVVLDELDDLFGALGADLLSEFLAVEERRGHGWGQSLRVDAGSARGIACGLALPVRF